MIASDIKNGSGWAGIIEGQNVAIYNDNGSLIVLDNTCTHAGCQTEWNENEKSWDCPCHGSRYKPEGLVIKGPSGSPLPKLSYTKIDGDIRLI